MIRVLINFLGRFQAFLNPLFIFPAGTDGGFPLPLNHWKPRLHEQDLYMDDIMSKLLLRQVELDAAPFISRTGSIGLAPLNTQQSMKCG